MLEEDRKRLKREAAIVRARRGPDNRRRDAEARAARQAYLQRKAFSDQEKARRDKAYRMRQIAASEEEAVYLSRKAAGLAVIQKRENYGKSRKR